MGKTPLDRRILVQVLNAPSCRARADDGHFEENIIMSYIRQEVDHTEELAVEHYSFS